MDKAGTFLDANEKGGQRNLPSLLGMILLASALFVGLSGTISAQRAKLSIPVFYHISWSPNNSGFGFGTGVKYSHHEVVGLYQAVKPTVFGFGIQYRYFLSIPHKVCSPFLSISGTKVTLRDLVGDSQTRYDVISTGIWLGIGASYRVWKDLSINATLGYGHTWFHAPMLPNYANNLATGHYRATILYDIPIIRNKDVVFEPNQSAEKANRLGIELRCGFGEGSELHPLARGNKIYLFPSLEYRFGGLIGGFASLQFGYLDTGGPAPVTKAMGFQGIGGGVRLYTWRRQRSSLRHEIGYYYADRPSWNHKSTGLNLSTHLLLKLTDGIDLSVGIDSRYNFADEDFYAVSVGLRCSPLAWVKRNL